MAAKILIVDDEAYIRRLIWRALEPLEDDGVEILIATNGVDALDLVKTELPQLVFLDVMMPQMDGFEVCNILKHELGLSNVYVVMLTAKGQEYDKQRGEKVGADIYMTKPFDPDTLLAKAEVVLGL
jgi:DNA-binding response OmpR family regulator